MIRIQIKCIWIHSTGKNDQRTLIYLENAVFPYPLSLIVSSPLLGSPDPLSPLPNPAGFSLEMSAHAGELTHHTGEHDSPHTTQYGESNRLLARPHFPGVGRYC